MENKKIIYIAGEGHSGSTLLAILLGNLDKTFCAGELSNFPIKGIQNGEYCSCGKRVPECKIWAKIIQEWDKKRILDLEEYIHQQKKLISNRNILFSTKRLKNPTEKISSYLNDTYHLYNIIFYQTKSNTIIDSSKSPNKIIILKRLGFDVDVIHLTRRFGDVLNSYKMSAKKDLAAGIEHEIVPQDTTYILLSWMLKNLLTILFSRKTGYKRIQYEQIVADPINHLPKLVSHDLGYAEKLKQRGPFIPEHLVAGNRIRMKNHIYIAEKPMGTSYHRLSNAEKLLARSVDFFY